MGKHTDRRHSGYVEVTGLAGELKRGETLSCVHCQHSWVVQPGSGYVRGFCPNCMGYHCGAPACRVCVPIERRLENVEAGRPELTPAPPLIVVPAGVLTGG